MNTLSSKLKNFINSQSIDPEEFDLWLSQYKGITIHNQFQLLRLANKYKLDTFCGEIGFFKNHQGEYQAWISTDGWAKLINEHLQFAGMSLKEANEFVEGVPTWMECSIYRHDRILPTVVKEYLIEVKTEQVLWQQMPRRMLRHRTIQQCARLAFNISMFDAFPSTSSSTKLKKDKGKMILGCNRVTLLKQHLENHIRE